MTDCKELAHPNDGRDPNRCDSGPSPCESASSGFSFRRKEPTFRVDYKRAKAILKEPSDITGENLFDHLVEIIKRIIDERPTNVTDYFEQFSRYVRENNLPTYDIANEDPYAEPQFVTIAEAVIRPLKPEFVVVEEEYYEESPEFGEEAQMTIEKKHERVLAPNENVLQLLHLWWFSGFGFQIDEMFQLSWAINRVQFHRGIQNARFWGRIYGVKGSYYIVEATLTESETRNRSEKMKANLLEKMIDFIKQRKRPPGGEVDPNLIPGATWEHEGLLQMQHQVAPVPQLPKIEEIFEAPPEEIGTGLNRRTYFVTTSLSDDWQELPLVTPKHIEASRKIKKFLTGNLEARLACFPLFPGSEKNYLRAMIARITSGTYAAPKGFYKRVTDKTEEEQEAEVEEEEDGDNDAPIMENPEYKARKPSLLESPTEWVHIRPNILAECRVAHVNATASIKELEREAMLKIRLGRNMQDMGEENGEEIEEEEVTADEEGEEEEGDLSLEEIGPRLFSSCDLDTDEENLPTWSNRSSSWKDRTNRMAFLRSELWPGAYSINFDKVCDCIYSGWGIKYVSRGISLEHVPDILNIDFPDVAFEATDPSVEMEERWRLYYEKKEQPGDEEMSDVSVDFDLDDKDEIQ